MAAGGFILDPRLAAESIALGDLELCHLLLFDDRRFPWLILVPRRPDLIEIHDLAAKDRALLVEEIAAATTAIKAATHCDKVNVAARKRHKLRLPAACPLSNWGKSPCTPPRASRRRSSRNSSMDAASSTASPCHSRARPE